MNEHDQAVSGFAGGDDEWAVRTDRRPTRRRTLLRTRRESGQASVEFALVVPFVCFLIWALVEFGIALNYYLDATHTASEGARLAAVLGSSPQPSGDLRTYIRSQLPGDLRDGGGAVTARATICINFATGASGTTKQIGDPVEVTVSAPYQWIPFIGGGTATIKGAATMRLEQLPGPAYPTGCQA
jgi:Flp pilus assembly protein TadG